MAEIKPIKNDEDLKEALAEIERLWDAAPESEDEAKLEFLSILVENYEDKHLKIGLPDPIEAIKIRLQQRGVEIKTSSPLMKKLFGSAPKTSEVLNKIRPLSLSMIRRIHTELDLPFEILLQEVKVKAAPSSTQLLHSDHDLV